MSELKCIKVILPFNVKTLQGDYRPVHKYLANHYPHEQFILTFCGNFIYVKLLGER